MDLNINNYSNKELIQLLYLPDKKIYSINELKNATLEKLEIITNDTSNGIDKNGLFNFFKDVFTRLANKLNINIPQYINDEIEKKRGKIAIKQNNLNQHSDNPSNIRNPSRNLVKPEHNTYSNVYRREIVPSNINPVLRETEKQNLHFNTKFRNKYYETSSTDFKYDLSQPCNNIISLKLSSICIPNSWYLFSHERENHRFIVEIKAKCLHSINEIIIPDGNYDQVTLTEYLNNRYFHLSGKKNPLQYVKVTICPFSLKTRFEFIADTPDGYLMDIKFVDGYTKNIIYTAGWILGFRFGQYLNIDKILLSEGLFDCGGDCYFYFCLDDFNKNVNNTNVVFFQDSVMKHQVLAKIYLIDGKFSVNIDENADDADNQTRTRKYHGPIDLKKIHIKIIDEFGRKINLNNMDYSFVLEVTNLYRKI